MKTITAEVAVVGAGTAGTATAYYLKQKGVDVALLEADDGFGAALRGVNGFFAVESAYMKSLHHRETRRDIFRYLMNHANWTIDAGQVSEFVNRSASVYDLLYSLGCRTEELVSYNFGAPYTWHYLDHDKPMFEALGEAYLALGGRLYGNTCVKQIELQNGAVCGLKAADMKTGEDILVQAKALVLACGEPGEVMGGKDPRKGDIFEIAAAAGAALAPAMTTVNAGVGGMPAPGQARPNFLYFTQPELLALNSRCERFTDESVLHAMEDGANTVLAQPGKRCYVLFDDSINEHFIRDGFTAYKYKMPGAKPADDTLCETIQAAADAGCFFWAESLAGLAEKIGLEPNALEAAVAEYNQLCTSGRDTKFFKDPRYLLPLRGPRYYCGLMTATASSYSGVVKTTPSCQVLDNNEQVIPGLYAAGGTCSTLNGPFYTHNCAGSRATFGVVCGQIIAETLPNYLKA